MLVKGTKRLILVVGPLLLLLYLVINFTGHYGFLSRLVDDSAESSLDVSSVYGSSGTSEDQTHLPKLPLDTGHSSNGQLDHSFEDLVLPGPINTPAAPLPQQDGSASKGKAVTDLSSEHTETSHHEIFSLSTTDKKFFLVDFHELNAINPNIIPHPTLNDTWIVVAQRRNDNSSLKFVEIFCNAVFKDGALHCLHHPNILPVAATVGGKCIGDFGYVNAIVGPHDARVLYGPEKPFIVYGSNSQFTCLGQFIQDFRVLVDDWEDMAGDTDYRFGTDLQRPGKWSVMEKNWFPFWDSAGQMFLHYDVAPKRVFAQVKPDGSVGRDVAPLAAKLDDQCMTKYMPQVAPTQESIHQATNSLKITLCRRADKLCIANESNTFIFTIFQHKKYYNFHSEYEPYVMMFQQRAPFEIYAMSRHPIWIHGREKHTDNHNSDMFYVTSMNWKQRDRRYHGYLDDEIFLAFGIEDERTGGMDVLAGDLLGDLGLCLDS